MKTLMMKPRHQLISQDKNEIQVSIKRMNGEGVKVTITPPEGCGEVWNEAFQLHTNAVLTVTIPISCSEFDQTDDEIIDNFETQMRKGAEADGIED